MSNLSLADLLESVDPTPTKRVSTTRAWLEGLPERDRIAAVRWIASGKSVACLWRTARESGTLPADLSLDTFTSAIRPIRAGLKAAVR